MAEDADMLLEVRDLRKQFQIPGARFGRVATFNAVNGVSFSIPAGSTFSLVGESGSGKSTVANLALGLDVPGEGEVRWRGRDIAALRAEERRAFRRETNAVFQDPLGSLDPRMTVGASLMEPLRGESLSAADRRARLAEGLRAVGLHPEHAQRYPHEFSGGQRQRVAIARALMRRPRLIVLDEPVASLDISIQAQILNLLKELQTQTGVSYLMISHNLATVRFMSHWVGVMYLGRLVEHGPSEAVFRSPQHPYTESLIEAARMTEAGAPPGAVSLRGEPPSAFEMPSGCEFHPRCPKQTERCAALRPRISVTPAGVQVACHLRA